FLLPDDQHTALQPYRVWRHCILSLTTRGPLPFLCRICYIFSASAVLARREEGGTMPASTRVSDHGPPAVAPADVLPEARLLATHKQAWEGLYVAYAHFPPGAFTLPPSTGHLITLHLGHPVPTVRQRDGRWATGVKVHGDIEIVPSGAPSFWAYERANEALGLILESAFVQQVALQAAQRAPERLELPHTFGTRDPFLEQLGLALYADLTAPGIGSRLLAGSIAQLLA